MSTKLLVFLLVLGIVAMTVQAGGKKDKGDSSKSKEKSKESKHNSKSQESKSEESKSNSKCDESKSSESKSDKSKSSESKSDESKSDDSKSDESKSDESNSKEDCKEPPVKPHKPPKKCGHNEEWTNCGTACPPTCDKPKPQVCILKCVVGCQCKKGLLRNKWGKCVEASHCSK